LDDFFHYPVLDLFPLRLVIFSRFGFYDKFFRGYFVKFFLLDGYFIDQLTNGILDFTIRSMNEIVFIFPLRIPGLSLDHIIIMFLSFLQLYDQTLLHEMVLNPIDFFQISSDLLDFLLTISITLFLWTSNFGLSSWFTKLK